MQCFDNDSVFITVNPLPVLTLVPDQEVCCDYGNIALNFYLTSSDPTGGAWSVPTNPTWENNNTFYTDMACGFNGPNLATNVYAHYTYTEPTTQCTNSDSVRITVKPLPEVWVEDGDYCQDAIEFAVDDITRRPANLNLGTQTWRCLECNGNNFSNMLVDKGFGGVPDYYIQVDEGTYTIQNQQIDTIVLELTYTGPYGCTNKDTAEIRIWKVPNIQFQAGRDLCWDEGAIDLNDLFDVNIDGGVWTVKDTLGNRAANQLGGITDSTDINTLNSTEWDYAVNPVRGFYVRYTHTATGCPAFRDTILRINPRPIIDITSFDRDPAEYCDVDANEVLRASPSGSGGVWTTNDPAALIGGNTFSPSTATANTDLWFYYTYTNNNTGCRNVDSVMARVRPQPDVILPPDTAFCRPLGQMTVNSTIDAVSSNLAQPLQWSTFALDGSGLNASLNTNSGDQVTATFSLSNDTTYRFIVTARTGIAGACPNKNATRVYTIYPRPDAAIEPTLDADCNPLTTDFDLTVYNAVDPLAAGYSWTLGNGESSTDPNPTATYTTDGTSNVQLVFTSAEGCDTTLSTSVDVYPLPNADFLPDPNNFTTAALPRFKFTDQSTVESILGSTITNWDWDFGDPLATDDISIEQNPTHFYGADTATYWVKLVVTTNHGCKDSMLLPVEVGPDLIVYIPNAFAPEFGGEEENDAFNAIISGEKSMELIIFNRWGEIMFQTNDKNEQWDGTFMGEPCQQDVYSYLLRATALDDDVYTYTGTITLLR